LLVQGQRTTHQGEVIMSATLDSLRNFAPDYDTRDAEARDQVALDKPEILAQQDRGIARLRRNATSQRGPINFTAEEPVRDAQRSYIDSLLQRMSQVAPEVYAIAKPWCDAAMETMTKRRASDVINRLKAQLATALAAQPEAPTEPAAPRPAWDSYDDIPTGYYAVDSDDGHTSFYHVLHHANGRLYVKLQVSDALTRIPWAVRQAALTKIRTAGPRQAAERYGREIGRCYRCNRTLTLEESRTNGLGSTCAGKVGW
jgi:hypothetical protein